MNVGAGTLRRRNIPWRLFWAVVSVVACGCSGTPTREDVGTASEPLQQCAAATVEGVDIYDGNGAITWSAVKAAGVDFAIIKATQGTYNTQTSFSTNWSQSKQAGLLRSAYHFFDPTEDGI